MDSTTYQSVLEEGLQDMYADDFVFMQDGAPCHPLQYTMLYLKKKKICLLSDWPPHAPNINVIQNMWSIVKTCVFQLNITLSDDLWNATFKAWNDISIETIYNLHNLFFVGLKQL